MAEPIPFRERLALTTSYQDILEVPEGKYAEFSFAQAPNIDGTNSVDISLQWVDPDAVATELASNAEIEPQDAVSPLAGVLRLLPLDKLQGRASANGDAVITVSGVYLDMPAS